MKFVIDRTSTLLHNGKLCNEAQQVTFLVQVNSNWRSLADAQSNQYGREWLAHGKNHREEEGRVVCDIEKTVWAIDIVTLEDLLEFVKKYGDTLISESNYKKIPFELEIYGGYRT